MERNDLGTCPYCQGGTAEPTKGSSWAVYCRRPDGAVRIPSREEYARFCATDHYRDCPGFRRSFVDQMLGGVER